MWLELLSNTWERGVHQRIMHRPLRHSQCRLFVVLNVIPLSWPLMLIVSDFKSAGLRSLNQLFCSGKMHQIVSDQTPAHWLLLHATK